MSDTANVIQQGTQSILRAYENKGAAQAHLGGAIASGVASLGVGIFRQVAKKKEEEDFAALDGIMKGSSLTGDPKAFISALAQYTPKTLAGQRKKLEYIGVARGMMSDLREETSAKAAAEFKNAQTAKFGADKADAETVREARAWARANPNATPPTQYLGIKEAADAIREEQDQAREIDAYRTKEQEKKDEAENQQAAVGILRGRSAVDLRDEELYDVETKNPKLGGALRKQRDTGRNFATSGERQRTEQELEAIYKEGMLPVRDEAGKIVGKRPNPVNEELKAERKARADREIADYNARTKDRADKATRGKVEDAMADLEAERQTLTATINGLMDDKMSGKRPAAGFDDDIQRARDRLAQLPEEAKKIRSGSANPRLAELRSKIRDGTATLEENAEFIRLKEGK